MMAVFYVSLGLITEQLIGSPAIAPAETQAVMLARMPLLLGFIFIATLLSFVFYIGIIYRIDNIVNQREDSFIETLQFGLKKFPAMLVAAILYTLALMGGILLFVIPGIIVSLSMAFYLYFIVIDSLGGYAALKASHKLVWGNWWRTTTVFMAPGIVMLVVFFTLGALVAFLGVGNSPLVNIASNLASAFITPYFFTLGYVQFHDLKLRKLGADLAVRLAK